MKRHYVDYTSLGLYLKSSKVKHGGAKTDGEYFTVIVQ
jgi:hypothetical protein